MNLQRTTECLLWRPSVQNWSFLSALLLHIKAKSGGVRHLLWLRNDLEGAYKRHEGGTTVYESLWCPREGNFLRLSGKEILWSVSQRLCLPWKKVLLLKQRGVVTFLAKVSALRTWYPTYPVSESQYDKEMVLTSQRYRKTRSCT